MVAITLHRATKKRKKRCQVAQVSGVHLKVLLMVRVVVGNKNTICNWIF